VRHELGVSDDATMILTVGGLREQKGHDLIIAAIPEIAEGHPKATFVWAGEGQWRSHLRRWRLSVTLWIRSYVRPPSRRRGDY
jgi:glycogen synthase